MDLCPLQNKNSGGAIGLGQWQLAAPAMITAGAIYPNRKFMLKPTGLLALQNYIRETFNKEIHRRADCIWSRK